MSSKTLTIKECQTIIFNLGLEFGVSPRLILSHLLDDHDKIDMLAGDLSIEELRCHVEAWKANGMRDLVGRPKGVEATSPEDKGIKFIKPFITYAESSLGKNHDSK